MKSQKFITAENLPDLADAFARSVAPVLEAGGDLTVSVIGEPGVGKSYISGKLSDAVTGPHITAQTMTIPRENMHDLILWSVRESDRLQIRTVDEGSVRFVPPEYRDFVLQQRELHPVPPRVKPGITFVEHPDEEMEEASDVVLRVSFSPQQREAILMLRSLMDPNNPQDLVALKSDIAKVTAQGCLLEMEVHGHRVERAPLVEFFGEFSGEFMGAGETAARREDDEPDIELAM